MEASSTLRLQARYRPARSPVALTSLGPDSQLFVVVAMPEQQLKRRAQRAKVEGKAPTTQAGEFIREEMHHIREGKHGARSTKQAVAIGLSKARRAGVDLPPPGKGEVSERTRKSAQRAYARGHGAPP